MLASSPVRCYAGGEGQKGSVGRSMLRAPMTAQRSPDGTCADGATSRRCFSWTVSGKTRYLTESPVSCPQTKCPCTRQGPLVLPGAPAAT